jgi:hypothetical protein
LFTAPRGSFRVATRGDESRCTTGLDLVGNSRVRVKFA